MSSRTEFDLAVIGGGPGGAAAALEAGRRGLRVGLFEPQAHPDKPCGEGLLPGGVAALRALGLEDALAEALPLERIRYVLGARQELEIPLPIAGRALERPLLMAALERALGREPGITRIEQRVRTERLPSGGFLVLARRDGAREEFLARSLIAADGLRGEAAGWLRRSKGGGRRFGLRARAEARTALEHVEVHLGRGCEVYLTPLPGARINVAVLFDEPPASAHSAQACLEHALELHAGARERLGAWLTPPESRALFRSAPRRVAAAGAFLVGDAAGGVDPVLGCGVTIALTTGRAAARAAADIAHDVPGAHERRYASFVRHETRLRRQVAGGLTLLARHPRLQRGVARLLDAWPRAGARIARRVGGT